VDERGRKSSQEGEQWILVQEKEGERENRVKIGIRR
jgi:hypothetical protein